MSSTEKPLKIAIIGAGIVGTFTAILLSKLPNIELTVFEKTQQLHEVGAWISITNSSFEILRHVIDIKELNKIVYRGDKLKTYLIRHWQTGEVLFEQPELTTDPDLIEARTPRVPFHNLLLSYVPKGIIKYDHKLTSLLNFEKGYKLNFLDKESQYLDLVIAADGIYSKIRHQIFPDIAKVVYKGSVAYRSVFDESILADLELPRDVSAWSNMQGDIIYMSRVGLRKYGIVAILKEPSEFCKLGWDKSVSDDIRAHLLAKFQDWDSKVGDVLKRIPDIRSFPLETAPWLIDKMVIGQVVFIGDAAHPTSGAYGAGASFGLADAWALYRSLQEVCSLPIALQIFQQTRSFFLQRVVRQMQIDKEISQNPCKDELEWVKKLQIIYRGGDWLRTHNVELEFQMKRDENLLAILENNL